MTPYHLWREIVEDKNIALAILIGAMLAGHVHHHRRGRALSCGAARDCRSNAI